MLTQRSGVASSGIIGDEFLLQGMNRWGRGSPSPREVTEGCGGLAWVWEGRYVDKLLAVLGVWLSWREEKHSTTWMKYQNTSNEWISFLPLALYERWRSTTAANYAALLFILCSGLKCLIMSSNRKEILLVCSEWSRRTVGSVSPFSRNGTSFRREGIFSIVSENLYVIEQPEELK